MADTAAPAFEADPNTPDILRRAMALRREAGFHVRISGRDMPSEGFNAYAANADQRDRWIVSYRSRGYTVEIVQ